MKILSIGCLDDVDCALYKGGDSNASIFLEQNGNKRMNFQICRNILHGGHPDKYNATSNACICSNYMLTSRYPDGHIGNLEGKSSSPPHVFQGDPSTITCNGRDEYSYMFITIDIINSLILIYFMFKIFLPLLRVLNLLLAVKCKHYLNVITKHCCNICNHKSGNDNHDGNSKTNNKSKGIDAPSNSNSIQSSPATVHNRRHNIAPSRQSKRDSFVCLLLLGMSVISLFLNHVLAVCEYTIDWNLPLPSDPKVTTQYSPLYSAREVVYALFLVFLLICILHLNVSWINASKMIRDLDTKSFHSVKIQRILKVFVYLLEFLLIISTLVLFSFQLFQESLWIISIYSVLAMISATLGSRVIISSLISLVKYAETSGQAVHQQNHSSVQNNARLLREKANEIKKFSAKMNKFGFICIIFFYSILGLTYFGADTSDSVVTNAKAWLRRLSMFPLFLFYWTIKAYLIKMLHQAYPKMDHHSQIATGDHSAARNKIGPIQVLDSSPLPPPILTETNLRNAKVVREASEGQESDVENMVDRSLFTIDEQFGGETTYQDRSVTNAKI